MNRILFVEHPVPKSVVFSWVTAEHQRYVLSDRFTDILGPLLMR